MSYTIKSIPFKEFVFAKDILTQLVFSYHNIQFKSICIDPDDDIEGDYQDESQSVLVTASDNWSFLIYL